MVLRTPSEAADDISGSPIVAEGSTAPRPLDERFGEMPHVEDWRTPGYGGASRSDSETLAAAIAAVGAAGGGDIRLGATTGTSGPAYTLDGTLTIAHSNVTLIGQGQGGFRNSVALIRSSARTRLVASSTFPLNTPLVEFTAVAGAQGGRGGGLRNLLLDGNSRANRCLSLKSWSFGAFEGVNAYAATEDNIYLGQFAGALSAAPYDSQFNYFNRVSSHNYNLAVTARALRLVGGHGNGATVGGNSCFNTFVDSSFTGKGTDGVLLEDTDNNRFVGCQMATTGGTYGLVLGAPEQDSSGAGVGYARYNNFVACEIASCHARAGQSGGGSSGFNTFTPYLRSNAAALPVLETGAGGSFDAHVILDSAHGDSTMPQFVRTWASSQPITVYDGIILGNTTAASRTFTLPKANSYRGYSKPVIVRNIGTTANLVGVAAAPGDTVDGVASITFGPGIGKTFVCNGLTAWYSL